MSESHRDDFIRGSELFNARRYFESHELLERVWLQADGAEKAVLRGLIQAAASLLHLERGNLVGARSLMLKSVTNLDKAPDRFSGIVLAGFARRLEKAVMAAEAGDSSAVRPVLGRAN